MARGNSQNNNSSSAGHSSKNNSSIAASSSSSSSNRTATTSSANPSSSGENSAETGFFARLQTPEAVEYMRYFVLLNSLFILLAMGIPYMIPALNVFKIGMALSVLLWYGAAVLRFVNDFFHHQFLKQLEEEYMQHPELRNLDVLQSRIARTPPIQNYADDESKISGVGGNSGGISLDGNVAKDENDNPKISKMDSEDELPDAFSIHPDHHYHSILIPSQSGGQGRDQKPQSGFTEGEWISMAGEDTEHTDFSMNYLHDYDYYYNYHDHQHHVDDDDTGDGPPSNRYFPDSSCGVGVANAKDTDIRWVTSSADLSKVEHLDHILQNHDAYCTAPSEQPDHNIEPDDRMDSVDDDYDRYVDFHKYVDEQLLLNGGYEEDLDSSHYFKTNFPVSSASRSSSASILSKVLLVKLIWW